MPGEADTCRKFVVPLLQKAGWDDAPHGEAQFRLSDVLEVPLLDAFGNVIEISQRFGGALQLKEAITELAQLLYAA
ncbi:MAG: hypothetical protein HQL77_00725 [Magnetococcales bacterium]|nr:hypothetical protein [Magnetococcales bacterium]